MSHDSHRIFARLRLTGPASFRRCFLGLPTLVLAAMVAAGCSAGGSARETVSGWFGADKTTAVNAYARSGRVPVYAEPNSDAKVLGHLSMAEQVVRTNERNGYVHVDARSGALQGWVPASRLSARRPSSSAANPPTAAAPTTGGAAAPTDGAAESPAEAIAADEQHDDDAGDSVEADGAESGTASDDAADAAGSPAAPGSSGVGASVFDPY